VNIHQIRGEAGAAKFYEIFFTGIDFAPEILKNAVLNINGLILIIKIVIFYDIPV
jgi:hypothetical protein